MRVRTQLYKGDLAKVVSLDSSRGQAQVKLVPRMDFAAMAKARAEGGAANRFGRQAPGAVRPQARSACSSNCSSLSPYLVSWVSHGLFRDKNQIIVKLDRIRKVPASITTQ